jgi:hypothetical protein
VPGLTSPEFGFPLSPTNYLSHIRSSHIRLQSSVWVPLSVESNGIYLLDRLCVFACSLDRHQTNIKPICCQQHQLIPPAALGLGAAAAADKREMSSCAACYMCLRFVSGDVTSDASAACARRGACSIQQLPPGTVAPPPPRRDRQQSGPSRGLIKAGLTSGDGVFGLASTKSVEDLLGGRARWPLAAMPSDAVPILVPGPGVQHGVLSLQTAHEARPAAGRRGCGWWNRGGDRARAASLSPPLCSCGLRCSLRGLPDRAGLS